MQKLINIDKKYENFRWFFTSEDILAVGGKSDEQNELAIRNFLKPDYTLVHTSAPGSPFMILQSENPTEKDIEEIAVFCACFSKQWKEGKNLIEVDVFKGNQIYKNKLMKTGTFGVKGEKKTLKVKPSLIMIIQKGKLRAVPKTTKEKKLVEIKQGRLTKEQAAEKIAKKLKNVYHFPFSKDEIMSAIPSDKLDVK
jgi:predicted ribosome quality control (RQC) complex YloA/Tae2 family protein